MYTIFVRRSSASNVGQIARFAEEMDVERVLCLTATATKEVADDICKQFFIDTQAGIFRTPVYRPK